MCWKRDEKEWADLFIYFTECNHTLAFGIQACGIKKRRRRGLASDLKRLAAWVPDMPLQVDVEIINLEADREKVVEKANYVWNLSQLSGSALWDVTCFFS